jgi:hypothetical protein
MPAENRGFWRRIAPKSVEPERGSPDMKWKLLSGIAALRFFNARKLLRVRRLKS